MKKVFIYLSAIVVVLLFGNCKKSSTPTSGGGSPPLNTSGGTYGYLESTRSYYLQRSTSSLTSGFLPLCNANFSSPQTYAAVSAGTVMVGNIKLQAVSLGWYVDSTNMVSICPTNWKVSGSSVIPSFTYTCNDSMPKYTGYLLLPDSITKSQNLVLQINGVSGGDNLSVQITDGINSTTSGHSYFQMLNTISANNSINIPSSAMAGFTTTAVSGTTGLITVTVIKNNFQSFSGKNFEFNTQMQVNNYLIIK